MAQKYLVGDIFMVDNQPRKIGLCFVFMAIKQLMEV